MKTYYIRLDENNYITDIITFPYKDYVKMELTDYPPVDVYAGYYKFANDTYELDTVKYRAHLEVMLAEIKETYADNYLEIFEECYPGAYNKYFQS